MPDGEDRMHGEQDLQTCFVVAGFRGAGKSTIIKTSYDLDLRLFGEKYHQQFRGTGETGHHGENDDYDMAIKIGANFQGRHIHDLAKEPSPPQSLLIQVDLKHVIHKLGYTAASRDDRKKIKKVTSIPTQLKSKSDPKICDLMVKGFLEHPFFRRFKTILVNTVHTDFDDNYRQFKFRKAGGVPVDFDEPGEHLRKAHRLVYSSWNKNIKILNPVESFMTSVDSSGDLISNGRCICKNWKEKAGFANPLVA